MGTTVVCAWVIGDKLYSTHVGNSRIYLLRNRRLTQLNVDHTWVREADRDRIRNNVHRDLGGDFPGPVAADPICDDSKDYRGRIVVVEGVE